MIGIHDLQSGAMVYSCSCHYSSFIFTTMSEPAITCISCAKIFHDAEINPGWICAHGFGSYFSKGHLMPLYGSCYDNCFAFFCEEVKDVEEDQNKKICDRCIDDWVERGKLSIPHFYPTCLMCEKRITSVAQYRLAETVNVEKCCVNSGEYHNWRPLLETEKKKLAEFLLKNSKEVKETEEAKEMKEQKAIWICCGTPQKDMSVLAPGQFDLRLSTEENRAQGRIPERAVGQKLSLAEFFKNHPGSGVSTSDSLTRLSERWNP